MENNKHSNYLSRTDFVEFGCLASTRLQEFNELREGMNALTGDGKEPIGDDYIYRVRIILN